MPDVETSCFPGRAGGRSPSLKAGSGQTSAFEEAHFERSTSPKNSARLKQVLVIIDFHPAMWFWPPGESWRVPIGAGLATRGPDIGDRQRPSDRSSAAIFLHSHWIPWPI